MIIIDLLMKRWKTTIKINAIAGVNFSYHILYSQTENQLPPIFLDLGKWIGSNKKQSGLVSSKY